MLLDIFREKASTFDRKFVADLFLSDHSRMRLIMIDSSKSSFQLARLALGFTAITAFLGFGDSAFAQQRNVKTTPVMNTSDLKWADAVNLPPGAKVAILASAGDWSVRRVKFP